jgi:excisionase family DNA binding protein
VSNHVLLTPAEVAIWAKVSERTVRRAIARGELRAGRAGGQLRIAPEDAHLWVFGRLEEVKIVSFPAGVDATLAPVHSDEGGSP